jgi:hypothetical protein
MKSEKNEKSRAYTFIEYAWENEKTDSYLRLNTLMFDVLNLAIDANMEFHESDILTIANKMRGGYWFGCNSNGKGIGESFYSRAIDSRNVSAIKSYEAFTELKPFILNNNRIHSRSKLRGGEYRYSVTGFDFDKKKVHIVAYDIGDWEQEGKRKLLNFNNKEWLVFRKNVSFF